MDGENVDTIEACKTKPRETAADEARLRPDHAFHHHRFGRLHRLERGRRIRLRAQRHIARFLERQHLGHRRAQHHPVARPQHDGLQVVAQRQPFAEHVDDREALLHREARLGDGLADQVGIQRDQDLRHEPALLLVRQHRGQRLAVRQKERTEDRGVENAHPGKHQPCQRDLEHPERRHALLLRHAVHDDVGGRADQRRRPPKNRREGKRDKQLRRRNIDRPCETDCDRDENDHHRSVVDEGRKQHHAEHQRNHRQRRRALLRERCHLSPDPVDHAGTLQRRRQHEHRPHRDGGCIREDRQGIADGQDARQHQRAHGQQGHHVRRNFLAHESEEHENDKHQHEADLEGRAFKDRCEHEGSGCR